MRYEFRAMFEVASIVDADASMMAQVLMNLVVNARDAMPKGGRITISTAQADLEIAHAVANPACRPAVSYDWQYRTQVAASTWQH